MWEKQASKLYVILYNAGRSENKWVYRIGGAGKLPCVQAEGQKHLTGQVPNISASCEIVWIKVRKLHTNVSYSSKHNFTVSVTAVTGGLDSPSTNVWFLICPTGCRATRLRVLLDSTTHKKTSHDRTFFYRFNDPVGNHCCSVFGMLSFGSQYACMYSFEMILIKNTTCNNSILT